MTKQASKGVNILQSPDERKKFRRSVEDIAAQLQFIEDRRETIKEMTAELSEMYGLKPTDIRKWASFIHKGDFNEKAEKTEKNHQLFDIIFNGQTQNTMFLDVEDMED